MNKEHNKERYIEKAYQLGAEHAVLFGIGDIAFDPRTIIKCMFGCSDWGKGHTCPSRPGSLMPWEYKEVFEKYSWGVIIHAHNKKTCQEVSFAIEREAFINGCYFAFSLSDCSLCKECLGLSGKECVNSKKARPLFTAWASTCLKQCAVSGCRLKRWQAKMRSKTGTPPCSSSKLISSI